MSALQKLTKKQKKGIAFRERNSGSQRSKPTIDGLTEMDFNAIPAMEDQDLADMQGSSVEVDRDANQKKGEGSRKKGGEHGEGKHKGKVSAGQGKARLDTKVKKRKRDEEVDVVGRGAEKKKKVEQPGETKTEPVAVAKKKEKQEEVKQRFILFVGNLKYTTPREAIESHFAKCDPPPTIRLLTPKPKPGVAVRPKSKGCAFLEFSHRNALQQALKLHQSTLDGRMINVELTAGGGGKGESRLQKVRERNKSLLSQREDRLEKDSMTSKGTETFTLPGKPQRYSATSGIVQAPVVKRTWTVGDNMEEQTRRGGIKHSKPSKGHAKQWGTGVNAIPVG